MKTYVIHWRNKTTGETGGQTEPQFWKLDELVSNIDWLNGKFPHLEHWYEEAAR
jgi:hypothetical protein